VPSFSGDRETFDLAPSCRYALPSRDALVTRLLGVPKILLMLCTEKNVLGSDYEAPVDAEQGGGRLEFTCLPPERDTMWTVWVVPLARGEMTHSQPLLHSDVYEVYQILKELLVCRY
jgi:hypothetical protein